MRYNQETNMFDLSEQIFIVWKGRVRESDSAEKA